MADLKLSFQREILTDFVTESGLLILGDGLGAFEVLSGMLECYATPKLLVVLLGLGEEEEARLEDKFTGGVEELIGHVPFRAVRTATAGGAEARQQIYLAGGVVSVTSRIALMDILKGTMPVCLVTGICLFRAEKAAEDGLEAFVLHLYREQNKEGFIKAFSESAEAFHSSSFNRIERTLTSLQVQELRLYPRFHALVKADLDDAKVELEELLVSPSKRTRILQTALTTLIEGCLRELTKANAYLEGEPVAMSLAGVLGKDFDALVRQTLEPAWTQLGFKTRQLVGEVRTLRGLVNALFEMDAVTFARYLEVVLVSETRGPYGSTAYWIVMDAANTLIQVTRERAEAPLGELEEPPKWAALLGLIEAEQKQSGNVLVMVASEQQRAQLERLLAYGPKHVLAKTALAYQKWKAQSSSSKLVMPMRKRPKRLPRATVTVDIEEDNDETKDGEQTPTLPIELTNGNDEDVDAVLESKQVHVRSYAEHNIFILEAIQPTTVIMYDLRVDFVRSLEVFRAKHEKSSPDLAPLKAYSLMCKDSTEEQRHLLAIRREKAAFEALIKAKAQMVIPTVAKSVDDSFDEASVLVATRRDTDDEEHNPIRHQLIVDTRDLRSALPFVLHKSGFKLIPETLEIGDYILSPEIAVERKSIPDLLQSLNSGRLYAQIDAMSRAFRHPLLLIEFDQNQHSFFSLGGDLKADIGATDVLSKLVLLFLAFPRLRLVWSSSLPATAAIFHDLQRGQKDPSITVPSSSSSTQSQTYNPTPHAMLMAMPGITSHNCHQILERCASIRELCRWSKDQIVGLIGSTNGQLLYDFLHTPIAQFKS